ncbi:hypothetical protein [Thermoflexus sp.]|uniref:hypothetical protein n=1 Tax=Thermoflexus sp. TaxID=1969742 RepID=UPI002ADE5FD5|nr:hypothetical protein [Thermoflexus sp.]
MPRGRKPSPVRYRRFVLTLSLHPVADAALIAALEAAPPGRRAALVREWLRGARPGLPEAGEEEIPDLSGLG